MNSLTYLVMYSLPLVSLVVFKRTPLRTAILLVYIGGFILLPQAVLSLPHIPYDKLDALAYAALIGIFSVNSKDLLSFKPSAIDLPIICWCVSPMLSSLSNDLGFLDGLNGIIARVLKYGIPYLIGRVYFNSSAKLKELALGIVLGGIFLIPFVLYEIKMSPQLHSKVYGWYPHDFLETMRGGGAWRPSVFMAHGLELAIWNAAACFLGWQMFANKILPKQIPFLKSQWRTPLILLTIGFVGSRSSGAFSLSMISFGLCWFCARYKIKWPILVFGFVTVLYPLLRGSQAWNGASLIQASTALFGVSHTSSLAFRMLNENLLAEKASQQPWFGWGEFGRSYVTNKDGNAISVPDGKWILVYGQNGVFGLISHWAVLFLPATLLLMKRKVTDLFASHLLPSTLFAVWCYTTLADDCFNAMNTPLIFMAAGGLSTLYSIPASRDQDGRKETSPVVEVNASPVRTF